MLQCSKKNLAQKVCNGIRRKISLKSKKGSERVFTSIVPKLEEVEIKMAKCLLLAFLTTFKLNITLATCKIPYHNGRMILTLIEF